jgi:hypothetical protein
MFKSQFGIWIDVGKMKLIRNVSFIMFAAYDKCVDLPWSILDVSMLQARSKVTNIAI